MQYAFELLQPVNRLLDIWCGHSGRSPEYVEISQWSDEMWNSATIHLHPVLRTNQFFQTLDQAIAHMCPDPNLQKLHRSDPDALTITLCLRFLWHRPCKFAELVTYWCSHKPRLEAYRQVSSIIGGSVAPVGKLSDRQAQDELKFLLNELVLDHLVLIELPS